MFARSRDPAPAKADLNVAVRDYRLSALALLRGHFPASLAARSRRGKSDAAPAQIGREDFRENKSLRC